MAEDMEIVLADGAGERRLNSLCDIAVPDFSANYSSPNNGNPFEPTISTPETFITSADYGVFTLNRPGLNYGYKTYGLVRAVVRDPVDDGFRGGIDIEIPEIDDPDELARLHEVMEENEDLEVAKSVMTWNRLFGGAGIIPVTDQDPSEPLDMAALHNSELRFLSADRWELILSGLMTSPAYGEEINILELARQQYGYASIGDYNYYGVPLNASRVVKMTGEEAPSLIRPRLQGWGMSVLERCMREIGTYIKFQNLLYELVDEAKVDIYKIENFNDQLATAQGTALIKLRVGLGNIIKNYQNALVMDMKDDYEQKQIAFSGLAEILVEFRVNLCASIKIPYGKLFDQRGQGLSSGDDSLENYNSMIETEVRSKSKRMLRWMVSLRCQQLWGYVPKFTIKFKPLRELNGVEQEQVNTSKQNRVMQLRTSDQITGKEADEILHKDGLLGIDTEVGQGLREPEPGAAEAQAQADAAASVEKKTGDDKKEKENARKFSALQNAVVKLRTALGAREGAPARKAA